MLNFCDFIQVYVFTTNDNFNTNKSILSKVYTQGGLTVIQ